MCSQPWIAQKLETQPERRATAHRPHDALGDGLQPMAAASAARRVAPYALVSALRDAGDRWQHVRSARCACEAADTAGSATCSHHHHDTFTARALEMGVDVAVNTSATAAERRCTVAGFTFFVAC